VIWTSSLLLAWLATAAIFGVVYRPARQGRKVAYLTVASFLFLVLALGLRLFLPSVHSPRDGTLSHPTARATTVDAAVAVGGRTYAGRADAPCAAGCASAALRGNAQQAGRLNSGGRLRILFVQCPWPNAHGRLRAHWRSQWPTIGSTGGAA
jgi:hypothetical protein